MQGRHPLHARYCTFNLLMASTFVAVLVEGCMRGWNQLSAGACTVSGASVVPLPVGWPFVKAVATQSFVEYYWHRLMHWRPCYKVG